MPRFYFHLRDEPDCDDEEGISLADTDAAYREALRSARSIMADEICNGRLLLNGEIEVVEESGTWRRTVPFREAVKMEG